MTRGSDGLRLELLEDGTAHLVLDRRGSRANFLSRAMVEALDALLGEVERLAADGRLRALLVRSAKPGSFIAGADLEEMRGVPGAAEGAAHARRG
ncbi:MAG TPA: hypothetical protein VHG28_09555, partial [Longimicrobiaceae bacterium]|nr:hypothetical protein [Longimicrobiaceae bacterium]